MIAVNKKVFLLLTFIFSLFSSIHLSNAATIKTTQPNRLSGETFDEGLNAIIRSAPPNVHFGITIQSMQTGQSLYEYNSNYLFQPASVQKLFVAVSALAFLKPDFRFMTRLLTDGKLVNGVLEGNLAVQFTGDPVLTRTDLINLLVQLKTQGIHQITGHVFVDNSAYDNVPYPAGWFWDDLSYSFAAPVNAVILNKNEFSFIVTPSSLNYPATITTNLPTGVINVDNQTITTSRTGTKCPVNLYSDFANDYKITGCISQATGKQYRTLALREPVILARVMIQNYLENNGISFQSPVLVHATHFTTVLAQHESPPLYLIVKAMLKHSDNLINSALLKKIGETYFQTQGTWRNSVYALESFLGKVAHIDFNRISIADGAGLSRYNLLSPTELIKLLYYAYHQGQVIPYLLNALPIAGVDGTLRWRMPALAKGELVHAKTGTMKGITCLAGYVNTNHNGTLGFVILMNGFVGHYTPYRSFEDKVCQYLVAAPRA